MKRLLFTLAGAAITAAAFAGPTLVWNNMGAQELVEHKNTYQHSYAPGVITNGSTAERGCEINLAAGANVLTAMAGNYVSYPTTVTAAMTYRVRLYAEDGSSTITGGAFTRNKPGTILYDSGQIPCHVFTSQAIVRSLPNVAVPAAFYYTCKPEGFDQAADTWGQQLSGPATLGGTYNRFLIRKNDQAVDTWLLVSGAYTGGPPTGIYGNIAGGMDARFWACGAPVVPFDNTTHKWEDWDTAAAGQIIYAPDANEFGDDVNCEGWNRACTSVDIKYIADTTNATTCTLRLYNLVADDINGTPDTVPFATSAAVPVSDLTAGEHTLNIPITATLPEKFVYTLQFSGVTQVAGDAIGQVLYDDPASGVSGCTNMWDLDITPSWSGLWFGYPWLDAPTFGAADGYLAGTYNNAICNFGAKFNVAAVPLKVNAEAVVASTGAIFAGNLASATGVDASYLEVRPGVVFSNAFDPACLDFTTHVPCNDPSSLTCTVTLRASVGRIRFRTKLPTYPGGTFSGPGTAGDSTGYEGGAPATSLPFAAAPDLVYTMAVPVANIGDMSTRYETKVRLQFRAMAAVFSYPWKAQINDIHWNYTP